MLSRPPILPARWLMPPMRAVQKARLESLKVPRSASKTSIAPRACAPRPARIFSTNLPQPMNPPSPRTSGMQARSCSASSIWTSSRWGLQMKPRASGRSQIRGGAMMAQMPSLPPAARLVAQPLPLQPIFVLAQQPPTQAALSASQPPLQAPSASSQPMAAPAAMAWSPSPPPLIKLAPSPKRLKIAPFC